ncbi:hypothetical protein J8273_3638 [Carpediemonas membranifera]|uniref:Uncharacterized protein n=1 Tax=Carpediemonas membranifera TaxID=201153 RepID=A0A8J6AU21_9EUKA|nr:hypothetical protein J8273_3638 [Carpediemonas membranifera]|eukprot:KAG9394666.1 hypothetical protein J8273_3638 [Carpediemonas membranifera]
MSELPQLAQGFLHELCKHSPDISKLFAAQDDVLTGLVASLKGPQPTSQGIMALASLCRSSSDAAMKVLDSDAVETLIALVGSNDDAAVQVSAIQVLTGIVAHSEEHAKRLIARVSQDRLATLLGRILPGSSKPPSPTAPPRPRLSVHESVSNKLIDSLGRTPAPSTPSTLRTVVLHTGPIRALTTANNTSEDEEEEAKAASESYSYYSYDSDSDSDSESDSDSGDETPASKVNPTPTLIPQVPPSPPLAPAEPITDNTQVTGPSQSSQSEATLPPRPVKRKAPMEPVVQRKRVETSSSSESDEPAADPVPAPAPAPKVTPVPTKRSKSSDSDSDSGSESDGLADMIAMSGRKEAVQVGPTPAQRREAARLIKRTRSLDELHQSRHLIQTLAKEG